MRFPYKRTLALAAGAMLVAGLSACSSSSSSEDSPDPLLKSTAQGEVRGTQEGEMLAFRGVPYASAQRFAPPQAPAQRDDVLEAAEFGAACAQSSDSSPFVIPSEAEDCLFLNIYTPAEGSAHPVMVWIHGGAFQTGSGGSAYDPARLVANDVVVVTINYRLGALGFMAHPGLTAQQGFGSGNYGLMDQQEALRWVQANIANFGGDPGNVTIFGESAGGMSVLSHLISPPAAGLFHRAIVQSGSYSQTQISLADAEAEGEELAAEVGCSDADDVVACLREAPVRAILDGWIAIEPTTTPHRRPDLLPLSVTEALRDGLFNKVPVLTGNNRNEWTLFEAIREINGEEPRTDEFVAAVLGGALGASADVLYPPGNYTSANNRYSAFYGDAAFHCNALKQARQFARHVETFAYEFADQAPSILGAYEPSEGFVLGAAHAFEIQYVLNTEATLLERGATDKQIELANLMAQYWTSFARTGVPASAGGADWPSFVNDETIRVFDTEDETATITGSQFAATTGDGHRCVVFGGANPDS